MSAMYPAVSGSGWIRRSAQRARASPGYWPEVASAINRMFESIEIIRKLFTART